MPKVIFNNSAYQYAYKVLDIFSSGSKDENIGQYFRDLDDDDIVYFIKRVDEIYPVDVNFTLDFLGSRFVIAQMAKEISGSFRCGEHGILLPKGTLISNVKQMKRTIWIHIH